MSGYVKSACCGASVVGMVDVTLHPKLRTDGTFGAIEDTFRGIKYDVSRSAAPELLETYCSECGGSEWRVVSAEPTA